MTTIAVLALQGAFAEHEEMLHQLGCNTIEIRQLLDMQQQEFDALILPGGESTTMMRLLADEGLLEPLRSLIARGMPTMGTCAGMILMSQSHLATMDIEVVRNAYGRQLGSFTTIAPVEGIGSDIPMTFIRAPYISRAGKGVEVLATVDGRIVAAQQERQLACAFHPELTSDTRLHAHFLSLLD